MILSRRNTSTRYIQLDTQRCKACWICLKNCPNKVIGKVNLPWHKHARISNPDVCSGCLSCINKCRFAAFSLFNENKKIKKQRKRTLYNFYINILLFFFGFLMTFSGLVLQIGFHMGGTDRQHYGRHFVTNQSIQYEKLRDIDPNKIVCEFNYRDWSSCHKYIIVSFTLLMIYHLFVHWKWYKGIIAKKIYGKNKQVISLTITFLVVALSGFIPWFIGLSGDASINRLSFIEIHDKITFILIVFLILHFIKRYNWFGKTYARLKGN